MVAAILSRVKCRATLMAACLVRIVCGLNIISYDTTQKFTYTLLERSCRYYNINAKAIRARCQRFEPMRMLLALPCHRVELASRVYLYLYLAHKLAPRERRTVERMR